MPAVGKITQVIGSTFDAHFPENELPDIYNAVTVDYTYSGDAVKLTGEVQQHLGGENQTGQGRSGINNHLLHA